MQKGFKKYGAQVVTGLEHFVKAPPAWASGARIGLLCNPASVDRGLRHARDLIVEKFPGCLRALYAPQHGFFAEKQDNMIESADMVDPAAGLPVFSLYGRTRIPDRDMFDPIDILLIDLQDVGTRVYTFMYTMSYCMEAARQYGRKVVVLDRPNPINGMAVEGNCLDPELASFVGRYPIPMRHGLTMGELAGLFNETFAIGCDLEVIPLQNWQRSMFYDDTGLPWIAPSPNLPTPAAAMVYPGQVLWEGTNISEGRGTTQPFEIFGAPFIDPLAILRELSGKPVHGAVLRPVSFEPTSGKWQGERCNGFQIHVADAARYRPYETSLRLLKVILRLYPKAFQWKQAPYEYEYEKRPIDLILGDRRIRKGLVRQTAISELRDQWQPKLDAFIRQSSPFHLYG